jgi:hypothetical protein
MATRFQFTRNADKPISDATVSIYKSNLNRIAKNLGITNEAGLISRDSDVIDWLNSQEYTPQQRKIFLSAIFYVINKAPYTDIQRKLYIEAFGEAKKEQVENSDLAPADKKLANKKIAKTTKNLKMNLKNEIVELAENLRIAELAAAEAKQKLLDAMTAMKK